MNGIRDASESNSASETQPSCAVVAFFQESEKSKLKNFRLSLRPPFLKVKKKETFFLIKEAPHKLVVSGRLSTLLLDAPE